MSNFSIQSIELFAREGIMRSHCIIACLLVAGAIQLKGATFQKPVLTGEYRAYHTITFTWDGPYAKEDSTLNPFTDYRLVLRMHYEESGGEFYSVPGYFAADGNAANSGATSGNKWKAHFNTSWPGRYSYKVFFHTGTNIALDTNMANGTPIEGINNDTGFVFYADSGDKEISTNKPPPDLRGYGKVEYRESYIGNLLLATKKGIAYIMGGPASPENLLACTDIDNTPDNGSLRKSWQAHVQDWAAGDTSWAGGKGKGIIGAINYLSAVGMHTLTVPTLTLGAADANVFPYSRSTDRTRFDCSKLDQWQIVFETAQRKGLFIELKTQLAANEKLLGSGALDPERTLYYRELVARFGQNVSMAWNLGDNNTQTTEAQRAMAACFARLDPYFIQPTGQRPVTIGAAPGSETAVLTALMNDSSLYNSFSLAPALTDAHAKTLEWVNATRGGKKKVIFTGIESGRASGVPTDDDPAGQDSVRKYGLWGAIMAGGAGVTYYFGSNSDLECQDFRTRSNIWKFTRNAFDFFTTCAPDVFMDLSNGDTLTSAADDYCLASVTRWSGILAPYFIYLPHGGTTNINLSHLGTTDTFNTYWFNPRTGVYTVGGRIIGGLVAAIGDPPSEPEQDWAICITDQELNTGCRYSRPVGALRTGATVRTVITRDGRISLALPKASGNDVMEVMRCDGKVIATFGTGATSVTYRLPARGMYMICRMVSGGRTVVGWALYL
jgi:hypothetical protein